MPLDKITVDSISSNAVTNIAIANGSIVSVDLADQSITNSKLSTNLTISLVRTLEEANINSIAVGGNVNIDVSNNTTFFFDANTTANVTFNVRANVGSTFDSATTVGEATSLSITVRHGTNRHEANLSIDGVIQTLNYASNTKPSQVAISSAEINRFNYTIFKTAANTYRILASNTLFGLG